eukprot:g1774.t1
MKNISTFLENLVHPRRRGSSSDGDPSILDASTAKGIAPDKSPRVEDVSFRRHTHSFGSSKEAVKIDPKKVAKDGRAVYKCIVDGMETKVAPLPSIKYLQKHKKEYVGPTDESNWVLPGQLIVGAYPGAVDDATHQQQIMGIMKSGVSTFVCLQSEYDASATEEEWKSGKKIRPYVNDAARICHQLQKEKKKKSKQSETDEKEVNQISFVHCPIHDCDVQEDDVIIKLATTILRRLDRGEVIYLHCWGGHGRAGTVGSIVLGLLFGLNGTDSMTYIQTLHDFRKFPLGVPSPQTMHQREQVSRILEEFYAKK